MGGHEFKGTAHFPAPMSKTSAHVEIELLITSCQVVIVPKFVYLFLSTQSALASSPRPLVACSAVSGFSLKVFGAFQVAFAHHDRRRRWECSGCFHIFPKKLLVTRLALAAQQLEDIDFLFDPTIAHVASLTGELPAGGGPFKYQTSFKLSQPTKHREHQPAVWRRNFRPVP